MMNYEQICKRNDEQDNVRLYEVVELLLEIKLDEKNGMQIPTQTDIKSNCCNKLINIYNGLKIEYLKNKTLSKEEFKSKVEILLHDDEALFKEAKDIVETLKTSYREEYEEEL